MWVLDHLDDLDADFRRFYRIDGVADGEFGGLSGPRFLALAYRVSAFGGVMQARLEQQRDQGQDVERAGVRVPQEWTQGDVHVVDGSGESLMANAAALGLA